MSKGAFSLSLLAAFEFFSFTLWAQMDGVVLEPRPPQAQTRRELDAFLDIIQCPVPERIPSLAADFVRQFPQSEFLGHIYRVEMNYYHSVNDLENAIAAGERSLAENPRDLHVLLTLASLLAAQAGDPKNSGGLLDKAEDCARRGLKEAAALGVAPTVSLSEREKLISQMKASAYEALGVIAFKRGKLPESIEALRLSTQENPRPDGGQFYRLGIALLFNGEINPARVALMRAAELGPEVVRKKAEEQLSRMEKRPAGNALPDSSLR